MAYPNFHAARIKEPGEFIEKSIRNKTLPNSNGVQLLTGKLKGGDGAMVAQSYRFPKDKYSVEQTKKWLKDNKVKYIVFEPAKEEKKKKESIIPGSDDFSPGAFVTAVTDAFREHFKTEKQRPDGSWPHCYIKHDAVYTDHVIAEIENDLYSIPFEMKDGVIEFAGQEKWTKVEQTYTPIQENVRIISAKKVEGEEEPQGWEWEVVLIGAATEADIIREGNQTYIRSKNGVPYSAAALEESVPLWDKIKVYDNHLTDEEFSARGTMRSVVNELVGVIVDPVWDRVKMAITGTLKVIDDKLRAKLLNSLNQNVLDAFGLSIDSLCKEGSATIGGKSIRVVEKIAKAFSVDVVADPAAGGRLARMIAGTSPLQRNLSNHQEVLDMEKEELEKLLKDTVSEAMSGVDERFRTIEARLDEENDPPVDTDPEPDPEPVATAAPKIDPATVELQEAVKKSQEEISKMRQEMQLDNCRSMLARKLEGCGLPDSYRNMVAKQFRDKVFEEKDIDEVIKEHREALAKLSESGDIVLPEGSNIHVLPLTEWDRHELAFLRLVAGSTRFNELVSKDQAKHYGVEALARYIESGKPALPRVTKLSDFYFEFTKDYEMEGRMCNKRYLEANVTTTTLSSIVKNTVNLLAAADYSVKPLWWEAIVRQEDVDTPDQATLVRTYGISDLSTIDEGGVYTEATWSDDEETAAFVKRGNYIAVTLETFLMDKLARVRTLPTRLANAWYGKISSLVSAVFTVNSGAGPVLGDTGALFNATAVGTGGGHANYLTTALSWTAYDAVVTAMMKQTDQPLGAGKKLMIRPKYLLVPVDLRTTALKIRNSEKTPGSANQDINPYHQEFEVIPVPEWTDTNNWAAVADPSIFPAIWLIWLRGRRTPEIFSVEDERSGSMFTNDELRFKVRQFGFRFSSTYDCAPVADFRPLHKSVV
ncbi:MAG: Mu-like prophage major head subunit gpT family protein [Anaerolineales bacterium]|nr:Mu-like prophage major head subunit gpT family protein [Anaerolineales bacterium]